MPCPHIGSSGNEDLHKVRTDVALSITQRVDIGGRREEVGYSIGVHGIFGIVIHEEMSIVWKSRECHFSSLQRSIVSVASHIAVRLDMLIATKHVVMTGRMHHAIVHGMHRILSQRGRSIPLQMRTRLMVVVTVVVVGCRGRTIRLLVCCTILPGVELEVAILTRPYCFSIGIDYSGGGR